MSLCIACFVIIIIIIVHIYLYIYLPETCIHLLVVSVDVNTTHYYCDYGDRNLFQFTEINVICVYNVQLMEWIEVIGSQVTLREMIAQVSSMTE